MIADYKSTLHMEWEWYQVLNHHPLNFLRTDTQKSEHKGFAQLLKDCFAAVRKPLAHEPKILWDGEEDAADYFPSSHCFTVGSTSAFPLSLTANLQSNYNPDHANH